MNKFSILLSILILTSNFIACGSSSQVRGERSRISSLEDSGIGGERTIIITSLLEAGIHGCDADRGESTREVNRTCYTHYLKNVPQEIERQKREYEEEIKTAERTLERSSPDSQEYQDALMTKNNRIERIGKLKVVEGMLPRIVQYYYKRPFLKENQRAKKARSSLLELFEDSEDIEESDGEQLAEMTTLQDLGEDIDASA